MTESDNEEGKLACPDCSNLLPFPVIKMDSYRCLNCKCEYLMTIEYDEEEMKRIYVATKFKN